MKRLIAVPLLMLGACSSLQVSPCMSYDPYIKQVGIVLSKEATGLHVCRERLNSDFLEPEMPFEDNMDPLVDS